MRSICLFVLSLSLSPVSPRLSPFLFSSYGGGEREGEGSEPPDPAVGGARRGGGWSKAQEMRARTHASKRASEQTNKRADQGNTQASKQENEQAS